MGLFVSQICKETRPSMKPAHQGVPLINDKTRTITEINQRGSPLLRLPSELRNSIYEYALGGVLIKIWQPEVPLCYNYRIGFCYYANSNHHNDGLLFSLIKVSRTIYAEAHLMPIALNTFVTSCNDAFSRTLDQMTPSQRYAVTTIQYMPYDRPFKLLQEILNRDTMSNDPILSQDWSSEWSRFEVLKRLGGLRKVNVGNYGNPYMSEDLENMLVAGFRYATGKQDIEVEFLGRTAWARFQTKLPLSETVQLECRLRLLA